MKSITDFLTSLKENRFPVYIFDTKGLNLGFLLYKVFEHLQKKLLLIIPEEKDLNILYDELSFFSTSVYKIPSIDIPPYTNLFPSIEVIGERNSSLFRLINNEAGIYLISAKSAVEPVIPKLLMKESYIYLLKNEEFNFEKLKESLVLLGYQRVEHVEIVGDFNIKGGIIDIFSPYHKYPVRIEFFGDMIESIRLFDPVSQRSIKEIEEAFIIPVKTLIGSFEPDLVHEKIKDYADKNGIPKHLRDEVYEKIMEQKNIPGESFYSPVIYGSESFAIEYFKDCLIILNKPEEIEDKVRDYEDIIEKSYEMKKNEIFSLLPKDIINKDCIQFLARNASIIIGSMLEKEQLVLDFEDNFILKNPLDTRIKSHPIERFLDFINDERNLFKILIVAVSQLQAKRISEIISHFFVSTPEIISNYMEFESKSELGRIYITNGFLTKGFKNYTERIWIFTEEEIFGKVEKRKEKITKKELSSVISDLYELNIGDLVVHIDHGIGIYRGLKQVEVLGKKGEFIEIEYADNDKLFVPVDKIGYVQKYIAEEDYVAKIDKLGDKRWHKTKKKIKEDLRNWAEEIIRIDALRKSQKGYAFKVDPIALEEFSASFEFEETEDQLKAIEETLSDMEKEEPMDRLICGDVGFGKTEVALRASFVAVNCKKQVCLIAPTTILAEQHYNVFKRRLEPFGFNVGIISRFVDKSEQKKVLESLRNGEIDVIIGTHRLLSKDVVFKDLGLLIIDEEHKFGVAHKEKIKSLKATVDILTLTATPIPRTLYMSISGLKNISIIVSPPKGRQSIKTFVTNFSESVIRDAVEREVQRGGQVFFIHNRVKGIGAMKKYLERILPGISIMVAHGQMEEEDLKKVMELFNAGKANILLSTAIVESGLDLPNVNTILVNRADKFGLADLYQLRGRVGRSNRKAYAYFLIPSYETVTKEALKRLKIIQELEELGSGFRLAVHDLEIRGAGDILGKKQSGHINEVGLELYMQLLEEAVREIRFEKGEIVAKTEEISSEVKLPFPAYIPEWYMESSRERMDFYKKIFGAKSKEDIKNIVDELEDRFGKIPDELDNLIYQKELEIDLAKVGCVGCYFNDDRLVITFENEFVPPKEVINNILKGVKGTKFVIPDKFYIPLNYKGKDVSEVKKVLQLFLEHVTIKR